MLLKLYAMLQFILMSTILIFGQFLDCLIRLASLQGKKTNGNIKPMCSNCWE